MRYRIVLGYRTDTWPNFAAIVVDTAETDPPPGSERWLTQIEVTARKTLNSRDVLILSWDPMVEEPER